MGARRSVATAVALATAVTACVAIVSFSAGMYTAVDLSSAGPSAAIALDGSDFDSSSSSMSGPGSGASGASGDEEISDAVGSDSVQTMDAADADADADADVDADADALLSEAIKAHPQFDVMVDAVIQTAWASDREDALVKMFGATGATAACPGRSEHRYVVGTPGGGKLSNTAIWVPTVDITSANSVTDSAAEELARLGIKIGVGSRDAARGEHLKAELLAEGAHDDDIHSSVSSEDTDPEEPVLDDTVVALAKKNCTTFVGVVMEAAKAKMIDEAVALGARNGLATCSAYNHAPWYLCPLTANVKWNTPAKCKAAFDNMKVKGDADMWSFDVRIPIGKVAGELRLEEAKLTCQVYSCKKHAPAWFKGLTEDATNDGIFFGGSLVDEAEQRAAGDPSWVEKCVPVPTPAPTPPTPPPTPRPASGGYGCTHNCGNTFKYVVPRSAYGATHRSQLIGNGRSSGEENRRANRGR